MKNHAPERYHDALIPQTEIGCKRKVIDTDYLAENVELVHSDPIKEVTEAGVHTQSGRQVYADAIILANGFQTQQVLFPIEITGEKGITLNEHVCLPWRFALSLD
jgi:cation diffusion facilitator CzcD-associated flavoprotein CzcO